MNNENNTGGMAFPTTLDSDDGMTLLDYFAAKAMQGIIGAGSSMIDQDQSLNARAGSANAIENVAAVSYIIASAMIAERNKRLNNQTKQS